MASRPKVSSIRPSTQTMLLMRTLITACSSFARFQRSSGGLQLPQGGIEEFTKSHEQHPYSGLPSKAFWRRVVGSSDLSEVDPVGEFDLRITRETRVATAGSCFAQHIARHLREAGLNCDITETAHPIRPAKLRTAHGYGPFSARFENIHNAAAASIAQASIWRYSPRRGRLDGEWWRGC